MLYFDMVTPNTTHQKMLPEPIRASDDIVNIAAEAEADVINQYTALGTDVGGAGTAIGSSGYYVLLDGYEEDPDDVDTDLYPNFKTDMARAIAAVVRWRFEQRRREVGLSNESTDVASKTYTQRFSDDLWPPGWDRWLRKYDIRPQPWSL